MSYVLAVDIGGTFTDLVALDEETGEVLVDKSSSLADDPIKAVLRVVAKTGIRVDEAELFVHGTTVTTNALVERAGTRVAYVTNKGFRDAIFIQNANRRDLYSLEWKKPRPLAARHDCLEVDCRIDSRGRILQDLVSDDVERVIEHLRCEVVSSVAISFLFSYLNPVHELELARGLTEALPDLSISMSHEVYPRWRENDRGHTTIADAYLKPMFRRYTENLQGGLEEAGSPARLLVMKSNGGVVEAETAAERPVNYLVSGPVGGVMGGRHFAAMAGFERIMTIDIGGTSCDVSLVERSELPRAENFEIEFGIPVKAPMVDIRTIGAGGGSIAWIDAGGLLRVGPQSAGSTPGPACYGQGGTEPTVTDANLVLGRLNPHNFCGGEIPLQLELATSAIERVATQLGQSADDAAHAVIELANHNMVDALSVISVEKGIDPRDFCLVLRGRGSVTRGRDRGDPRCWHGCRSSVPWEHVGLRPANGGLRTDLATTRPIRSDDPNRVDRLNEKLGPLRERAIETLLREGFKGTPEVDQRLEMRYLGQNYHRETALAVHAPITDSDFDAAVQRFHADYRDFYGYDQPWEVVETVGVIVSAIGRRAGPAAHFRATRREEPIVSARDVYFATRGFVPLTLPSAPPSILGKDARAHWWSRKRSRPRSFPRTPVSACTRAAVC